MSRNALSDLKLSVIVLISHTVVHELKTIKEYIAGAIVSADSIHESQIHEIAFQKLFFSLSRDNHQVMSLLKIENGFSQVSICVHKIVHAVIHAFFRNDIFLLVKNLNNP